MVRLSVIIPTVNDPALQKTIDDVRRNATGDIEVVVVMDGVDTTVAGADVVIKNHPRVNLRASVNRGVEASHGDYIMKIDDHCMFDEGYDEKILATIEEDWIVIPRRYHLDPVKWCIFEADPNPIDYERLVINNPDKIGGATWRSRTKERKDILLDETMVFQGSCYVMSRQWWNHLGPLQEEGYGGFAQEPIELALKTWLSGGKVVVNKHTWYAHKHRTFKRVVCHPSQDIARGNLYSRDFWLNNRWEKRMHDLSWLMERFGLPCQ